MRTLCLAYKEVFPGDGESLLIVGGIDHRDEVSEDNPEIEEGGFTCIGILGIKDVLRDGVEQAIAWCQNAGIRVIITSSGGPSSALAVAKDCGVIKDVTEGSSITGDVF